MPIFCSAIVRCIRRYRSPSRLRNRGPNGTEEWNDMRWIMPALGINGHPLQQQNVVELSQRRKEFIQETLVLKKVIKESTPDDDNEKEDMIDDSADEPPPFQKQLKSDLILPMTDAINKNGDGDTDSIDEDDGSFPTCTICFSHYQEGDAICWSNNPDCSHMFHKDCIEEWLMRADECPCCRLDYMMQKPSEEEDGDSIAPSCEAPTTASAETLPTNTIGSGRRPRQPMERVPPLSSEQTAALERGDSDYVGPVNTEESLANMLATIEQIYGNAQLQLYYENHDGRGEQQNSNAARMGPRIVAIPTPAIRNHLRRQQQRRQREQERINGSRNAPVQLVFENNREQEQNSTEAAARLEPRTTLTSMDSFGQQPRLRRYQESEQQQGQLRRERVIEEEEQQNGHVDIEMGSPQETQEQQEEERPGGAP